MKIYTLLIDDIEVFYSVCHTVLALEEKPLQPTDRDKLTELLPGQPEEIPFKKVFSDNISMGFILRVRFMFGGVETVLHGGWHKKEDALSAVAKDDSEYITPYLFIEKFHTLPTIKGRLV